MARTQKLFMGKDYKEKRTLSALPAEQQEKLKLAGVDSLTDHFNVVETTEDFDLLFSTMQRDYRERYARSRHARFSESVSVATEEVLKTKPLPKQLLSGVMTLIRRSIWKSNGNAEQFLMSAHALNEFLAQEDSVTYGEFLEENWDTLYERYRRWDFSVHSWSNNLLTNTWGIHILSIRPGLSKAFQESLESVTRAEAYELVKRNKLRDSVSNASAVTRLTVLLEELRGETVAAASKLELTNKVLATFAKGVGAGASGAQHSYVSLFKVFVEQAEKLSHCITEDRTKSSADSVFSSELQRYVDFIYERASEFETRELIFALFAWEPKFIARTGGRQELVKFINAVFERYGESQTSLEIFKLFGELAATTDRELPTMNQWQKALESETLESVFDVGITLSLITGTDKKAAPAPKVRDLRKVLRVNG